MNGEEILPFLTKCTATKNYFCTISSVHDIDDSLYERNSKNIFIINTSVPGRFGHWQLVFTKPGSIVLFDSFGVGKISELLQQFISQLDGTLIVNRIQLQQNSSCTCPAYVILFAVYLCLDYSLAEILSWFSPSNLKLNDFSVFQWLKKQTGVS